MAGTDELPEADRAPGCPHPRETFDLIGHKAAEQKFIHGFNQGKLHHAWLITGPPGVGKATLAYRMARFLLGAKSLLSDSLDIPADDSVAQRVASQGHGDLFVLRRPYDFKTKKLRSEIPISEARRLAEFFQTKPAEGGWRVCIVDSMDEMNQKSENAILKSLEEPPEQTILILLSNNPGKLLPTIRSRCLHLALRPVEPDLIAPWLKRRHPDASEGILDAAAKLSRGGPGKATALISNSDKVLGPLSQFLSGLASSSSVMDHKIAAQLSAANARSERQLFWEALQDIIHAQARFAATGNWTGAFKPLPVTKTPATWEALWSKCLHLQNREMALNMDKKSVMYDVLSAIRSA